MRKHTGAETGSASAFDANSVVFVIISSNNVVMLTYSMHCEPFSHFEKANALGHYAVVLQGCARFPETLIFFT